MLVLNKDEISYVQRSQMNKNKNKRERKKEKAQ